MTRRAEAADAVLDLSFTEELRWRPVQIAAPGFLDVEAVDVGPVDDLHWSDTPPVAPYVGVEVHVRAGRGTVVAGLADPGGGQLLAVWDRRRAEVAIEVRADGHAEVVRRCTAPDAATGVAFALCERQVTALLLLDGAWVPVLTERDRVAALVDPRRPEVLARQRMVWGAREGSVEVGDVRAGLFGMTGLRDPHLVQHQDGRPWLQDGRAWMTWTCAGLGFFQQAHWGVFSLAVDDPTDLRQEAHLFTARDGLVLGDHAGQLVRDDERDRWLVANSSWGDFDFTGVHVRHTTSVDELLTGVHVLRTERTALPTTVSSWDPGMTRIDGRWHVAFVESPSQQPFDFHPALARGPVDGAWPDGLELVGADTSLHQCEGPLLHRADGTWWLLASDGDGREYPVYDLQLRRAGRLAAPYPTNIPHPQILDLPGAPRVLVTFDGTQFHPEVMGYGGHGDVVVMRS
ncbi:MAG TPA: hypothetical protein VI452_06750 [Marmoricola sp.]